MGRAVQKDVVRGLRTSAAWTLISEGDSQAVEVT